MEELFKGQSLTTNTSDYPVSQLTQYKLVGLYFTAHWCPPCRTFTPKLINFYKAINESEKNMEIVFISYDRDQDAMMEYLDEMPWTAVPFNNEALREELGDKFGVTGIPMLVVLRPDGSEITRDARSHFTSKMIGAFSYWMQLRDDPNFAEEEGKDSTADEEEEVSDISREPIPGLVCDKGHSLIWHGDVGKYYKSKFGGASISCDYCKTGLKRSSWHCRECTFDMCKQCRDWVVDSQPDPTEGIMCLNKHTLRLSSNLADFYIRKYLNSNYTCRCCNAVLGGQNLHCRRCIFDVCSNCAQKLATCISKADLIKCDNQHSLEWQPDLSMKYQAKVGVPAFCCDVCRGQYMGSGSFHCDECTYDLCVNCMDQAVCKV